MKAKGIPPDTSPPSGKRLRRPLTRSEMMARVRSKDTKPEKLVRSLLHALGYRFRLHRRDLPGCPDIVLPGREAAIFVHGCFWHGHGCKRAGRLPKANADFWVQKLEANLARDARNRKALENLGWKVLVVWECELKDEDALTHLLCTFLS